MTSSTLFLIQDLVWPVLLGAFVLVSLALILSMAIRRRGTGLAGLPGVVPAIVAGIVVSLPLIALSALLSYGKPADRILSEVVLPGFLQIGGTVVLCVLDVYALFPPARRTGAGAIGRAFVGVVLSVGLFGVILNAYTTMNGVAGDAYLEEQRRAVAARSEGLSLEVAVVGVKLGAVNENGRLVDNITIDLTVRSADDVQLHEPHPAPGGDNQEMRIGPATFPTFNPSSGLHLPTLIPAGFEETYRITARLSADELAEYYVAGPWEARVYLYGLLDDDNLTMDYRVTTTFTVSGMP